MSDLTQLDDTKCCRKIMDQAKKKIKQHRLEVVREAMGFLLNETNSLESKNKLLDKLAIHMVRQGLYKANGKFSVERSCSFASARSGVLTQLYILNGCTTWEEKRDFRFKHFLGSPNWQNKYYFG